MAAGEVTVRNFFPVNFFRRFFSGNFVPDFVSGNFFVPEIFFDVGCIRLVPVTIVAINVIEMPRGFQEKSHFASTLLINASLL